MYMTLYIKNGERNYFIYVYIKHTYFIYCVYVCIWVRNEDIVVCVPT